MLLLLGLYKVRIRTDPSQMANISPISKCSLSIFVKYVLYISVYASTYSVPHFISRTTK